MPSDKLDEISTKKVNSIIQALENSFNQATPEQIIKQAFLSGKLTSKKEDTKPLKNKILISHSSAENIYGFNDNLNLNAIKYSSESRKEDISEIYNVFSRKLVIALNDRKNTGKKKSVIEPVNLLKKDNVEADSFSELFTKAFKSLDHQQPTKEPISFTQRIIKEKRRDWFSPIDKLQDENRARFQHAQPVIKNKLSNLKEKDVLNHELLKKIESMRSNIEGIKSEHRHDNWIRKLIEELNKPKNKQLSR